MQCSTILFARFHRSTSISSKIAMSNFFSYPFWIEYRSWRSSIWLNWSKLEEWLRLVHRYSVSWKKQYTNVSDAGRWKVPTSSTKNKTSPMEHVAPANHPAHLFWKELAVYIVTSRSWQSSRVHLRSCRAEYPDTRKWSLLVITWISLNLEKISRSLVCM